jgi:hypothetical protein
MNDVSVLNDPNWTPPDGYIYGWYCSPGQSISNPAGTIANHGAISVSSDGTIYIPFTTFNASYHAEPCDSSPDPAHPGYPHGVKYTDGAWSQSDSLQLMIIHPDGSYSTQQMDSVARNGVGPSPGYGLFEDNMGRAIPDGQGGVVTQVAIDSGGTLYHFSSSGTSKLGLTITPEVCPSYGSRPCDPLLLGEDGTAYLVGSSSNSPWPNTVAAIDSSSGTVKWSASPGLSPSLSTITSDGSVAFQYLSADFSSQYSALVSSAGQVSPLFANPANGSDVGPVARYGLHLPSYWTLGTWFASESDGSLTARAGTNMFVAASEHPQNGGSEKKDNKPHLPQVLNYLPSQIERQSAAVPNTIGFPCLQDGVNSPFKTLKNALRNYTQNSCGTNPPSSAAALVAQQYRLREAAIAQTFRSDLGKNLDAVAYIGHTSLANFGQPNEFSKGITFYYPLFDQKNAGDERSWDVLYPVSGTNTSDILAPECAAPDNFCENQASAYLNKLLPFEKDVTSVVGLGSSWDYRNHAATLAVEPGPPHSPDSSGEQNQPAS